MILLQRLAAESFTVKLSTQDKRQACKSKKEGAKEEVLNQAAQVDLKLKYS